MFEQTILTVSEFNQYVNLHLEQMGNLTIEGELSQFKISQGKWIFATIKDENASVEIFGSTFTIKNYSGLEEGMLVKVTGTPRLYQKTGRFSVSANEIIPSGEGALQIAFEKLRAKLEAEGLFDPARKRKIPAFPERIGLLTAKDSQAYADFVKVLKERIGGLSISFFPVQVQGKEAVESIIKAFHYFNEHSKEYDVLVLARGGGSLEDLMAFNDEQISRAIFSSKIPVVCGIGHEKDVSLADLTADLRASTPSNAAELIFKHRRELQEDVHYQINFIENSLRQMLESKQKQLVRHTQILESAIKGQIEIIKMLQERFAAVFRDFDKQLSLKKQNTLNHTKNLITTFSFLIQKEQTKLNHLRQKLSLLDYRQVLKRGFSLTTTASGEIVKNLSQLSLKSKIKTILSDGSAESTIEKLTKESFDD